MKFLSASFRLSAIENQPMGTFSHSCEVEIGALSPANQLTNLIVQKYFTIRVKHSLKICNQQTVRKILAATEMCRNYIVTYLSIYL